MAAVYSGSPKTRGSAAFRRAKACYANEMCIICIDFDRGALKPREARRALSEMREGLGSEHAKEVEQKLDAAEPEPDSSSNP